MPTDSSSSGMCVFVYAYVSIFAVAGLLLYGPSLVPPTPSKSDRGGGGSRLLQTSVESSRARRTGRPASSPDSYSILERIFEDDEGSSDEGGALPDDGLFARSRRNRSNRVLGEAPGKVGSSLSGSRGDGSSSSEDAIACPAVHSASDLEFVACGWTKAVYRAKVSGREVAIKTVNLNGKDVTQCRAEGRSMSACYRRAAAKLLREIVLLAELRHENVVKVLGSCVPDAVGPVAIVTELGDPLDTVKLLQLSWEDRLRLALGMARILHRLSHSPLGSLAMNDFRRQQFVLVGGTTLKLSDVDDVGISEPTCTTSEDCIRYLPMEMRNDSKSNNHQSAFPSPSCVQGQCSGHNERLNIWHAGRHFIQLFLPLSAPSSLKPHIQELLEAYHYAIWNSQQILDATERLVNSFVSGDYREDEENKQSPPIPADTSKIPLSEPIGQLQSLGFERVPDSDLPGIFDYRCHDSTSAVGCVISVFNEVEAAEICKRDPDCKAVVLGQDHTWTGRTIAVFKNGYGTPSVKLGYSLLLRKK